MADVEAGEPVTCWCSSSFLHPSYVPWQELVGNIWDAHIQHHLVERSKMHDIKNLLLSFSPELKQADDAMLGITEISSSIRKALCFDQIEPFFTTINYLTTINPTCLQYLWTLLYTFDSSKQFTQFENCTTHPTHFLPFDTKRVHHVPAAFPRMFSRILNYKPSHVTCTWTSNPNYPSIPHYT